MASYKFVSLRENISLLRRLDFRGPSVQALPQPSRAHVLSFAHYLQASASQANISLAWEFPCSIGGLKTSATSRTLTSFSLITKWKLLEHGILTCPCDALEQHWHMDCLIKRGFQVFLLHSLSSSFRYIRDHLIPFICRPWPACIEISFLSRQLWCYPYRPNRSTSYKRCSLCAFRTELKDYYS